MSPALLCFIALTLSNNVLQSEVITCNDSSGSCSWQCEANDHCEGNAYHCPPTSSSCSLSCKKCDNITINSSADEFNISCSKVKACSNLQITAATNTSSISLYCGPGPGSNYCDSITLNCPSQSAAICQCFDYGTNICNEEVYFSTKNPTNSPTNYSTNYPTYYPTDSPTNYPTNFPTIFNTTAMIQILNKMRQQQNDATLNFIWLAAAIFFTGCVMLVVMVALHTKCKSAPNRLIIEAKPSQKPKRKVILQEAKQNVMAGNNEMDIYNKDIVVEQDKVIDIMVSQLASNDDEICNATLEGIMNNLMVDGDICVDEIQLAEHVAEDKPYALPVSSLTGEKSDNICVDDEDEIALENIWNNDATEYW